MIVSGKRKYHLLRYYKKDHVQARIFWKDYLFRTFEENIIFPGIFWERSSFLLCLKNKIIFLGKRNIIFPDNTRKIIFQCNFFGKTIFSKHSEKENMVFPPVFVFVAGPLRYNRLTQSFNIMLQNDLQNLAMDLHFI